jgi:MFS transporter, FSR family, fosmidomycin resistance protein
VGSTINTEAPARKETQAKVAFTVLAAISFCHLLNDMVQSLIAAIYPVLKNAFHLNFSQLGLITLTFQATASLLQPFVGLYADRKPKPYSLPVGMGCTLIGLLLLSRAWNFEMILISSALVGVGSSVFHPESSRVARMASGGQHGLAQSLFQVGGNTGSAIGPLLAAFIVVPHGQHSISWFSVAALAAIVLLINVGHWYKRKAAAKPRAGAGPVGHHSAISSKRVFAAIVILAALVFSKYIYLVSLSNYYTFYLMSKFHLSVRASQIYLFLFLGAVAAGTIIGGPVGDRIGRKHVIWWSILGALPFTLALPYANLFWTSILSVVIGVILASAFSAIVVYAQELVPGKIGMISGLFFGFAFGVAGLGAALLGKLADQTSIRFVYQICSYLPAIGLLTALLPNVEPPKARRIV